MSSAPERPENGGGGKRHGVVAMILCCIPMVAILVLIALRAT